MKEYLSTREIILITLFSTLGGTLSSFIGFLALQLNFFFHTSFGAGQIVAGLHVYWLLLCALLVRQKGAATFAGLIKGTVEFFMGSHLGILVILISILQGLLIEVTLYIAHIAQIPRQNTAVLCLAGALSCLSPLIINLNLFFGGIDFVSRLVQLQADALYIVFVLILAMLSGAIFGGIFAKDSLQVINEAGLWNYESPPQDTQTMTRFSIKLSRRLLTSIFLMGVIICGGIFTIFTAPAILEQTFNPSLRYYCTLSGEISNPFIFYYHDFIANETIIEAELIGSYTHIPLQNYSGVILHEIIAASKPLLSAQFIIIRARDAYEAKFNLSAVMIDNELIISKNLETNMLRIVAANYVGGYWVDFITDIILTEN